MVVSCIETNSNNNNNNNNDNNNILYFQRVTQDDCLTLQEDLTSLRPWDANWRMKFNVAKCQSMRMTWHQPYQHVSEMSSKVTKAFGFLCRKLAFTYKTLVQPKLEYAAPI